MIDAKLAAEQTHELKLLVNMRFGHGTWQRIINERSRGSENIRKPKDYKQAKEKQQEELMIVQPSF